MFKIDNATAATVMPTPEAPGPNPDGFFQKGTFVTADWLNAVQEEICYVITEAGGTLDKTVRTQLYDAIHDIIVAFGGITEVEDDTSPTLGGDLEVNAHKIKSASGDVVFEAASGNIDLNSPTVLVNTDIVHRGDTNNKITFGTDTQNYQVDGSSIFDISASGFRLGATGARVTTIDNDTTLAANSATRLLTQHAAKTYVDGIIFHPTILFKGRVASSLTAGNTYYFADIFTVSSAPGGAVSTFYACFVAEIACTINNLLVYTDTAPGSGQTYTATVYKNGSSTTLTATISGATAVTASDTAHSVSLSAGDAICLQIVLSGSAATISNISWGVQGIG